MALDNSNTSIGYKLAMYRHRYNIGMYSNINSSITLLSASIISDEQVAIVNNLSKYIKPYYYNRPSMIKFIELMNIPNPKERFRMMLFLKIVLKRYAETLKQ